MVNKIFYVPCIHLVSSRIQSLTQFISLPHPTKHSKRDSSHLSVQIEFNSGTLKIFRLLKGETEPFKTYEHSVRGSISSGTSFLTSSPEPWPRAWQNTRAKNCINLWYVIFWRFLFWELNFKRLNRCELPRNKLLIFKLRSMQIIATLVKAMWIDKMCWQNNEITNNDLDYGTDLDFTDGDPSPRFVYLFPWQIKLCLCSITQVMCNILYVICMSYVLHIMNYT